MRTSNVLALFAAFLTVMLTLDNAVDAHPGRTDSKGGHNDRKTGTYHFHNSGRVAPTPRISPAPNPRITPVPAPKIGTGASTPKKLSEAFYRDYWAKKKGGLRTEVRCPDGTRCDIVSDKYAIEVDWAYKWYEGFGQALWYGFQLNKKPSLLLILRSSADSKYVIKAHSLAKHHGIDLQVATIGPGLTINSAPVTK